MRVALRVAYDGRFRGFAKQPIGGTVEDGLLEALTPLGLAEGTFKIGSRTDRGVAAVENVVAFELDRPHLDGFLLALQSKLPGGIFATGVVEVADDFDPRKAMRSYKYVLPEEGEDFNRMESACQRFVGEHDMTAFARMENRPPLRIIEAFDVAPGWVFSVRSPGFLWNQVRRMVGAVVAVGRGEASADDISESLRSGQPHKRFQTAPAHGLVLTRVETGLNWSHELRPRDAVAEQERLRDDTWWAETQKI